MSGDRAVGQDGLGPGGGGAGRDGRDPDSRHPDGRDPDSRRASGGAPAGRNAGGIGRGDTHAFTPDPLELNRRLPLWYQVSQSLRASILGRHPADPLRLPTEEQLAGHYGVGVLTMRQALKELADEGLITRHRRHGTFIEPGSRRSAPRRLLGSVDAVVAQQSGDVTTVLGHGPAKVTGELAEYFPDLAEIISYTRLRRDRESGEPVSWAENAVRPEAAAHIDVAALRDAPMTKVLRDAAGITIARITDTVRATLADPVTAELLDVPLLSPVLHYTGVTYDELGSVVDVARIRYRGDRFAFSVTVEA
jgi:GntR family transcriptional regulator